MLRVNQDNCTIEKLNCATGEWELWWPPTDCSAAEAAARTAEINRIVESSHGLPRETPTPAAGECVEYDLVLSCNQQLILPIRVDENDTITISQARGSTTESAVFAGVVARVFGPDGNGAHESGDPAPTIFHMRMIASIGGIWYDAYNTEITVPSGTVQDYVVLMANDNPINDNVGEYAFHIKICKSDTSVFDWTHTFDFTLGDQLGWGGPPSTNMTWQGTGWRCDSADSFVCSPDIPDTATIVKFVEVYYDPPIPAAGSSDNAILDCPYTTFLTPSHAGEHIGGGHFIYDMTANVTHYGGINVYMHQSGTEITLADLEQVRKVIVSGVGPDPFSA